MASRFTLGEAWQRARFLLGADQRGIRARLQP